MADGTLIFDTKLDANGLSTGLGKIGNVAGTAFKGVAVAAGVAATAVGFVAKSALDGYAAYEQLAGGVETLFKESANVVKGYAEDAYLTAGLSANAYMETVTSFSASLIQSLGGDTAKAAEVADMAIIDMSDNANKMGTDIAMIQNAYNGFAKGNFTMLDNLKLGYGGTQEEMKRLLAEAEKISGIKYDISSFADVAEAIHVIQTEMGIAGATAAEAATTIEGSTASMKAAWQNLLVGIADDEADLDSLIERFVESVEVAGENILPRVEVILTGIGSLIETMLPVIMNMLPSIINNTLPKLLSAGVALVQSLLTGITENLGAIADMAFTIVMQLVDIILANLPAIIETGLQVILQLAFGIAEALPELIPTLVDTVLMIVDTIIDNIDLLIDAALAIIIALAEGIIASLPKLLAKVPEVINALVEAFAHLMNRIVEVGNSIVNNIKDGIVRKWNTITGAVAGWISGLKDKFINAVKNFTEIGSNIVSGIWKGIEAGWTWLTSKVKSIASSLLDAAKDALGIESPSKEFKYIGEMCVAGFDSGIEDLMDGDTISRGINASVSTIGANTASSNPRVGGFNQTINVNKEVGTPDELARVVRLESRYGLMKGVAFA